MKCLFITLYVTGFALAVSANEKSDANKATDLVVRNTTLVQRCVLKGAPSTRMIAVGEPGGFNYAFDALNCAPVSTWTGGFLDIGGETKGRGGNACKALGVQQSLSANAVPLRVGRPDSLPSAIRFHGYRRDSKSGDPTFLFEVDGVAVEQKLHSPKPLVVTMAFAFPGKHEQSLFYLLDPGTHLHVNLGKGLKWNGSGIIEIPPGQSAADFEIYLKPTDKAFVREVEHLSGAELFHNFCSACHSIDGTKLIGPTFKGLWGREETIARNGVANTIKVDADYIRESILKPQVALVKGYETVPMADYSAVLTKDQVENLIHYLRELK
jgi:cytochrome c2